jgi:cell wall-associated NlpC family hydrolase
VITPALDSVEHAAEAVTAAPPTVPARTESALLAPGAAFDERATVAERASRATVRRAVPVRPAAAQRSRRPAVVAARTARAVERAAAREIKTFRAASARRTAEFRRAHRAHRAAQRVRPATTHRRSVVTKHAVTTLRHRVVQLRGGMSAVIAYARSQVGKRYVSGGEGPNGFDCSGFTKRAYARAGIRLPHSSGAQAARARNISRSQARPGDLVVGSGHVGIYMGRGMMIDAGNHRTGVVYRKLYSGLRVERL